MSTRRGKEKSLPRLRNILLILNLTILILPLGSIAFFRIYENELVRQTELELIAQGTVLAAAYQSALQRVDGYHPDYGKEIADYQPTVMDETFSPILPKLDLAAGRVLPPRPHGVNPGHLPDRVALKAASLLQPLLGRTQKVTLAGVKILDYHGIAVGGQHELWRSFAQVEEVQAALSGHYHSVLRQRLTDSPYPALASISRGTGIRAFVAIPVMQGNRLQGVIYLSRTPPNILKRLYVEQHKVAAAGASVLLITLLLALLTSYTISRPIQRLVEKTRRIAEGSIQEIRPLERPGTQELDRLSQSFAEMAQALHARGEYIREFATHVSHEFKTPLTAIQGAAELLQEHQQEMQPEQQQQFLANILHDTDRLKRLVSSLLELARADNLKPTDERCLLDTVLSGVVDRYRHDGLMVHLTGECKVQLAMSADNLHTVLVNLMENAVQHQARQLFIDIGVSETGVTLNIADDGSGISEANRQKLFTPFFTTRREQGGTGLGLGIVQSLVRAHHGTIEAVKTESGACFVLNLPGVSGA